MAGVYNGHYNSSFSKTIHIPMALDEEEHFANIVLGLYMPEGESKNVPQGQAKTHSVSRGPHRGRGT